MEPPSNQLKFTCESNVAASQGATMVVKISLPFLLQIRRWATYSAPAKDRSWQRKVSKIFQHKVLNTSLWGDNLPAATHQRSTENEHHQAQDFCGICSWILNLTKVVKSSSISPMAMVFHTSIHVYLKKSSPHGRPTFTRRPPASNSGVVLMGPWILSRTSSVTSLLWTKLNRHVFTKQWGL